MFYKQNFLKLYSQEKFKVKAKRDWFCRNFSKFFLHDLSFQKGLELNKLKLLLKL